MTDVLGGSSEIGSEIGQFVQGLDFQGLKIKTTILSKWHHK